MLSEFCKWENCVSGWFVLDQIPSIWGFRNKYILNTHIHSFIHTYKPEGWCRTVIFLFCHVMTFWERERKTIIHYHFRIDYILIITKVVKIISNALSLN